MVDDDGVEVAGLVLVGELNVPIARRDILKSSRRHWSAKLVFGVYGASSRHHFAKNGNVGPNGGVDGLVEVGEVVLVADLEQVGIRDIRTVPKR